MAIIKCPECGKEVSDKAKNCPNCGYPIAEEVNEVKAVKEKPSGRKKQNPLVEYGKGMTACGLDSEQMSQFLYSYLERNDITSSREDGYFGARIKLKQSSKVLFINYGTPQALKDSKTIMNVSGNVRLDDHGHIPENNHVDKLFTDLLEAFKQEYPGLSFEIRDCPYFEQLDIEIMGHKVSDEIRDSNERKYFDYGLTGRSQIREKLEKASYIFIAFLGFAGVIAGLYFGIIEPMTHKQNIPDEINEYNRIIESIEPEKTSSHYFKIKDALGKEFEVSLSANGDASYKRITAPTTELDEVGSRTVRRGINGTWRSSAIKVGDEYEHFYEISLSNGTGLYIYDGYAYDTYGDMKSKNYNAGYKVISGN